MKKCVTVSNCHALAMKQLWGRGVTVASRLSRSPGVEGVWCGMAGISAEGGISCAPQV